MYVLLRHHSTKPLTCNSGRVAADLASFPFERIWLALEQANQDVTPIQAPTRYEELVLVYGDKFYSS